MCMYDEDEDSPQVHRNAVRRAAKPHKCCECGRRIAVGEIYRYDFQVYDGFAGSWHTCAHCRVAQEWLVRECGGYLIEGTWEDIAEHVREYAALRFPLGRLMVRRRANWLDREGHLVPVPPVPKVSVEHYVV